MAQQTISKMETVQTAVDWLIEQLEQQVYTIDHKDNRVIPKSFDDIIEIKRQAKKMEKEQIVNAWDLGRRDIDYPANGEQYYNKIYEKNSTHN